MRLTQEHIDDILLWRHKNNVGSPFIMMLSAEYEVPIDVYEYAEERGILIVTRAAYAKERNK